MITQEDINSFEEDYRMQQQPDDMVRDYYATAGVEPEKYLCAALIEEEFDEWSDISLSFYLKEMEAELKELADLVYVIFGYAQSRGWDLMEAFRRVHENNMGRMYQPDGTIKRNEQGKILKNKDYPKVSLEDLV